MPINILLLSVFILGCTAQLFSNENENKPQKWIFKNSGNANFQQVALANWASGGENSHAADFLWQGFMKYTKGDFCWENNMKLAYGIVQSGSNSTNKSNDNIDFDTKICYTASNLWKYSFLYSFKSQFYRGYDYRKTPKTYISNFMSPGYMFFAFGMDYYPTDYFNLLLSPFTSKNTFVLDDQLTIVKSYGVKAGQKMLMEYGAYLKAKLKYPINDNVILESNLGLYSSYNNNPQNIDVNWEVLLKVKINKYFYTNIRTHLIFDDDIKIADKHGNKAARVQFKEAFGVGVGFSIDNDNKGKK